MQSKQVEVRSSVKRNAITLTFVGLVGIILGLVLFLSSSVLFAPALCAFALGIIATVLGVSKQMEPEVSITLSPDGLSYHHRRGSLFIEWENVQRFDIPKSLDGLETIELPFIGIRLKKSTQYLM